MACTLSQMMANRLNALRSSGPKTPEGKARSSQNARSHGLSRSVGATPPLEWAEQIESRKSSWRSSYQPIDAAQDYLFDRLVVESVRLDQCEARIAAARIEFADRASESWDDDRRAEVAQMASKLATAPDRIQPILLQSKHGVEWLLERWEEVASSIRYLQRWSGPNWQQAMDLLGLPLAARDSSTPHDIDPDDVSPTPGLAFIQQVVDLLRARLTDLLNARDSRARLDAEVGLEPTDPKPIRLLERYAADARRRVHWSIAELRKLQAASSPSRTAPEADASEPSFGPPEPRPDRRKPNQENTLLQEGSPARNEPRPPEAPARNEPSPTAPTEARSPLLASSAPSVSLNRRARRAQAAAAKRRS